MTRLGAVIAARLADWGTDRLPNERALFGTEDPEAIAATIDGFCSEHLGSPIASYRFFDSSSGSVHGVDLADGRAVVVKGHRPRVDAAFLAAVAAVQARLAAEGFPAPAPLAGPVRFGAGHLTAETLIPQRRPTDPHAPAVRRTLARGLADLVARASPRADLLAAVEHPMAEIVDGLYPAPHSARFDFAATTDGAEWIDALARTAREELAATHAEPEHVVHTDWRVENLSVADDRLLAVYDWDSVTVGEEIAAVATAALTFPVDWQVAGGRRFPRPAEIAAFVAEYAAARTRPLDDVARRRLAAHLVTSLAYGARCEHADLDGRPPEGPGSQRHLLAEIGPLLLAGGLDALSAAGG